MAGKTVIAIVAALGLSAITGVALGQFAVTQPHGQSDANTFTAQIGNPDAAYGPPPSVIAENARLNEGASTTPVCKGCGPTLSERRDRAYYGDGYEPFEDGGKRDYEFSEDPAQSATYAPDSASPPIATTISE